MLQMMVDQLRAEAPEEAAFTLAGANGAVSALRVAGFLSSPDAFTWHARIRDAAPEEAVAKSLRRVGGRSRGVATGRAPASAPQQTSPRDMRRPTVERPEPFRGEQLLRLLLLSPRRLGDLELTALEIYGDGIVIGWQHRNPPVGWLPLIEVRDDVGTVYQFRGMGSYGRPGAEAGGIGVRRAESVFGPTPAPEATVLRILGERTEVEVSLA